MVERLLAAVLVLCLGACANKMEVAEAKLGQSVQLLTGVYDRQGPASQPLVLVVAPIYVPTLSDYVFYLQEMVAEDPRRITGQRLMSFDPVKGGKIVQTSWALAEPARWRDGHLHPDLFKSMVKEDVRFGARTEVATDQLTETELAFDAAGRLVGQAESAQAVRYRKR